MSSTFFQELLASLQPRDVVELSPGNFGPVTNRIDLNALTTPGPVTNRIDLNALTTPGPVTNRIDLNSPMYDNTIGPPEELISDGTPPSAGKEALFASVLSAIQQEEQGGRAAQLIPPVAEIKPAAALPNEEQAVMQEQPITLAPRSGRVGAGPKTKAAPTAASPGAPAKDDELEALLALAKNTGPDRTGQKADLEKQRALLLAKADSEREFSDDEKVATALLAALPGLLGAIGGGAIAGGYGAAAGAAGGLQGGAEGIKGLVGAKEARRKEAKTDADKLAERIAMLDEKIAAQVEKANDREFDFKVRERANKKAEALDKEKMALQEKIARENNATQIKTTAMTQRGLMDRAQLDASVERAKALVSAAGGNQKLTDGDKAFFLSTGNGMRSVGNIRKLVAAGGANLGAHLRSDGAAHLLDTEVANLSHALTKIGDSQSAVLLGELKNTKETLLANPTTTRTNIFLEKVAAAEQKIARSAIDYSSVSGMKINPEVERAFGGQEQGAAKPAPYGDSVRQAGHTFKWNGFEYVEVQ